MQRRIIQAVEADCRHAPPQILGADDRVRYFEDCYLQRCREELQLHASIQAISRDPGPHENSVWEAAARWQLEARAQPKKPDFVLKYLALFGYAAADVLKWAPAEEDGPTLAFWLDNIGEHLGHQEHGGHTWYMVQCDLGPVPGAEPPAAGAPLSPAGGKATGGGERHLSWRAPRRLVQLRESLHDPVKDALGRRYAGFFKETPFAKRGGPKGTSLRLRHWLDRLAGLINRRAVSPFITALTLLFLRGPATDVMATLAAPMGIPRSGGFGSPVTPQGAPPRRDALAGADSPSAGQQPADNLRPVEEEQSVNGDESAGDMYKEGAPGGDACSDASSDLPQVQIALEEEPDGECWWQDGDPPAPAAGGEASPRGCAVGTSGGAGGDAQGGMWAARDWVADDGDDEIPMSIDLEVDDRLLGAVRGDARARRAARRLESLAPVAAPAPAPPVRPAAARGDWRGSDGRECSSV